jgi:2-polyprenyl-3-methyl-5-hydroxy-6-metoxy-1,4-benzoquinol methylase
LNNSRLHGDILENFDREIAERQRFQFGDNWARFLPLINERRILVAMASLKEWLDVEDLVGKTFLDIGCGSGLFSLAALRLGAEVYSFDVDQNSVACAQQLKEKYSPGDPHWTIGSGSIRDKDFLKSLGSFDMVYSWGVLHHTGDMWGAMENALIPLKHNGKLFIAIYNDQGVWSKYWLYVKKLYCSGSWGKIGVSMVFYPYFIAYGLLADLVRLRNPFRRYLDYQEQRGMSRFRDIDDWLGGLPFEVAKPEAIFDFYRQRGLIMEKMRTVGGNVGNNQFVFIKT